MPKQKTKPDTHGLDGVSVEVVCYALWGCPHCNDYHDLQDVPDLCQVLKCDNCGKESVVEEIMR